MLRVEPDFVRAAPDRTAPGAAESDFLGSLRSLRRWWWLPVLCALVAGASAYLLSSRQREYDATASLLFRAAPVTQGLFPGAVNTPTSDPERQAATNVGLVSLDVVARRVATGGGLGLTAAQVRKSVRIRADGGSDIVTVTARRPSAGAAASLANRYAQEFVAFRRDADRNTVLQAAQLVRSQLARLNATGQQGAEAKVLADRAATLEALAAVQTGNAEVVELAEPPSSPAAPHPRRAAIVAGTLGLILGLGIALLLTRLDQRMHEPEEAAQRLGVPSLAEVPHDRRLAGEPPNKLAAVETLESFRMLRTTLRYFTVAEEHLSTVLITSATPGEGKTTTSWNLALAAATDGDSALLIEADMRRPSLLRGVEARGAGLAPLLAGLASFAEAITPMPLPPTVKEHGGGRLDVLGAGDPPPNPLQLLQSQRMYDLLADARQHYDIVVIDSAAVTAVADALALVGAVDGVVVIARLGHTTRKQVDALARQFGNVRARILGVVVNDAPEAAPSYYSERQA